MCYSCQTESWGKGFINICMGKKKLDHEHCYHNPDSSLGKMAWVAFVGESQGSGVCD